MKRLIKHSIQPAPLEIKTDRCNFCNKELSKGVESRDLSGICKDCFEHEPGHEYLNQYSKNRLKKIKSQYTGIQAPQTPQDAKDPAEIEDYLTHMSMQLEQAYFQAGRNKFQFQDLFVPALENSLDNVTGVNWRQEVNIKELIRQISQQIINRNNVVADTIKKYLDTVYKNAVGRMQEQQPTETQPTQP